MKNMVSVKKEKHSDECNMVQKDGSSNAGFHTGSYLAELNLDHDSDVDRLMAWRENNLSSPEGMTYRKKQGK